MLSAIRRRITFANVAMTLALVFALSGGAYAASRYVITSAKQIKPSVLTEIAKKVKGAPGATGPQGAAGANGASGVGTPGTNGSNGTNGTNGKSVVSAEEAKSGASHCKEGGSNFEVEGSGKKTYACNGTTGFTETLPAGKTETGTWAFAGQGEGENQRVAISFPIPLERPLPAANAHFVTEKEENEDKIPAGCKGGSLETPTAEPGNLCVYEAHLGTKVVPNPAEPFLTTEFHALEAGVGKTGTILFLNVPAGAEGIGSGDWAVTEE